MFKQLKKLQLKYKRLAFYVGIPLLSVMLISGVQLYLENAKTYLPITNITVEGEFNHQLAGDIQQTVKAVIHGGYFTVDIVAIRNALIAKSWVEDVSIRRRWPAGLIVTVKEKNAIAYWGEKQLLSDSGEVYTPVAGMPKKDMPRLIGPKNLHKKVWVFLNQVNKKINSLNVEVKSLHLDERRSWELQLSNNMIVKLGRENTESRLLRFTKVFILDNALNMKNIDYMDLRYPNGFAIKMKSDQLGLHKMALVKEV